MKLPRRQALCSDENELTMFIKCIKNEFDLKFRRRTEVSDKKYDKYGNLINYEILVRCDSSCSGKDKFSYNGHMAEFNTIVDHQPTCKISRYLDNRKLIISFDSRFIYETKMNKKLDFFKVKLDYLEELKIWFRAFSFISGYRFLHKSTSDSLNGQTHIFICSGCNVSAVCDYSENVNCMKIKIRGKHSDTPVLALKNSETLASLKKQAKDLDKDKIRNEFILRKHDLMTKKSKKRKIEELIPEARSDEETESSEDENYITPSQKIAALAGIPKNKSRPPDLDLEKVDFKFIPNDTDFSMNDSNSKITVSSSDKRASANSSRIIQEVMIGNRVIKVSKILTESSYNVDFDQKAQKCAPDNDDAYDSFVEDFDTLDTTSELEGINLNDALELIKIDPDNEKSDFKSDLEMICIRTNSDYIAIDPVKIHVFTTHMMRQAAAHPCTQMMVFIGTTKLEIVYGYILTVISTRLPSGVYPIFITLHTEETVDQYITMLQALLEKYTNYFGGNHNPKYVMMDGNFAGFGAVEAVFRDSKIFICPRLTMTTLRSIASVIPDSRLRSLYNELTFKIITSPDRVESDRALHTLCNGKTANLPQVKEFMNIIKGYEGQVRICDRSSLGIGDRHFNHVTMSIITQIQNFLLEGQCFFTVQGALYWMIKEWDVRMFAKFIQSCQRPQRGLSPSIIKEMRMVIRHRLLNSSHHEGSHEHPAYELELLDQPSITVYTNETGCPCLGYLKAQMCGHIFYLVQKRLYEPNYMQPLVSRSQLAIEERLFLKERFIPTNTVNGFPIKLRPLPRPELPLTFSFQASLNSMRTGNLDLVRQMVDVLNRLPVPELQMRLLGTSKIIQLLHGHSAEKQDVILSLCTSGQYLSRVQVPTYVDANTCVPSTQDQLTDYYEDINEQDKSQPYQDCLQHDSRETEDEIEICFDNQDRNNADANRQFVSEPFNNEEVRAYRNSLSRWPRSERIKERIGKTKYKDSDLTDLQNSPENSFDLCEEDLDHLKTRSSSRSINKRRKQEQNERKTKQQPSSGYSAGRFSYATDFDEVDRELMASTESANQRFLAIKSRRYRNPEYEQTGDERIYDELLDSELDGNNDNTVEQQIRQMEQETHEAAYFLQPHRDSPEH